MAGGGPAEGTTYSPAVGLIYVFNLIVGTGALTLPLAFSQAGVLFGAVTLVVLAFFSFITVSWVIEAMAAANAVVNVKEENEGSRDSSHRRLNSGSPGSLVEAHSPDEAGDNVSVDSRADLISVSGSTSARSFEIVKRIEMGQMAALFFNKTGLILFYVCLIVYLYGDLAIYAAAVPKNARDMFCYDHDTAKPDLCWVPDQNGSVYNILPSRLNSRWLIYQIFLYIFMVLLGPFTFFNVQKTKFLQIATSIFRWLAISTMIGIASYRVIQGDGKGHPIIGGNVHGLPMLFGCSIYSFMCHHSLPGMVTPMSDKRKVLFLLGLSYMVIFAFYCFLCITAVLAFDNDKLQDMYTLNFINDPDIESSKFKGIKYFFGLFPVITLSTNYPIIATTLCNNFRSLFELLSTSSLFNRPESDDEDSRSRDVRRRCSVVFRWFMRWGVPLLTIIPPALVANFSSNLEKLVGFTGSYAGAGIQYIIPAFLALCSRRVITDQFGVNWPMRNPHRSPFYKNIYIWLTLAWTVLCISFVTVDKAGINSLINRPETVVTQVVEAQIISAEFSDG